MRSVCTSHACNFQDMGKWKSPRPSNSRKEGYTPCSCNFSYKRWIEASFKGWWWGVGNEYESKRTLTRTKWLQVWTFPERSGCRNKGTWKTNPCREAKEIKTTGSCYEKMYFFSPFLPQIKQANLDKDHFAMQTRLNLWMQLFVKTKNFSFKLRSLLSINQYSRKIPQRFGVFMAYVDK